MVGHGPRLLSFSTRKHNVCDLSLKNSELKPSKYLLGLSRQGRSQLEANRDTCFSPVRFDPSVLFKRSHHKDPN